MRQLICSLSRAWAVNECAASGRKAIVFSQWVETIKQLRDRLGQFHPLEYHGQIPGKKRDALPKLGSWAKTGFTWAPEVLQLGNRYLLYYTASDSRKGMQCIGVAESRDPLGPFVDSRPEPIVCQTDRGK